MRRWLGSLGLALVVGATLVGQEARFYSGTVIDSVTGGGVEASLVTAYRDAGRRTDSAACPEFGVREGATTALLGGQFLLPVPPSVTTFAAVYCRPGYFPRVEPVNPQIDPALGPVAAARVSADPVDLLPLKATPGQVRAAMQRQIDRLRATIRYYESAAGPAQQRVPWEAALGELRQTDPTASQIVDLARRSAPGR